MAAIDVTKKLRVYHTLYRLNLSFANIVAHCRTLQEIGAFTAESAKLFQGFTQELQADINQSLLDKVHSKELDDWSRYGKIRQTWEKKLRDPDDVLLAAEKRKRELKKAHKQAPDKGRK
jgi:hypothetical protein